MCISLSFCLVSIRSSWRARRRPRPAGKRGLSDESSRAGRDTEKSSVQNDLRSDERPHQASLSSIRERPRSRRGSVREPPVIIGDPTDTNTFSQENVRKTSSRSSTRQVEITTPRSSRHSIRRSLYGPDDIPSANSFDLRIIPMIPQEESEDILFTPSPHHSQSQSPSRSRSHSHSHTPTHRPAHTIFQP